MAKKQLKSILKELRIGIINGLIIGAVSFIFVLIYLVITKAEVNLNEGFKLSSCLLVSGIIAISMLVSITLSSVIGTCFPLLLTKMKIDPAVASGPFITTLNDISSVIIYYGLTFILFIVLFFFIKKNQLRYYLVSYGTFRFVLEYFRGDSRGASFISFLSPSQFLSVLMIILGIVLFIFGDSIVNWLKKKYSPELLEN